jgi:hypothetical protein
MQRPCWLVGTRFHPHTSVPNVATVAATCSLSILCSARSVAETAKSPGTPQSLPQTKSLTL